MNETFLGNQSVSLENFKIKKFQSSFLKISRGSEKVSNKLFPLACPVLETIGSKVHLKRQNVLMIKFRLKLQKKAKEKTSFEL